MHANDWGMTQYPFVPGHEVAGIVEEVGAAVTHLQNGQRVGLGWFSHSCMTCQQCMEGDHNLCPSAQGTLVGRHGGFADRVRADAAWVVPLPDGIETAIAGPLFCGGITVFSPILQSGVKPTDRVGVVGIGGLGHMALEFLRAWGCEVTAFSSNPDKEADARRFGAHHFVNSRDASALESIAGSLDFILVTVNVGLDWNAYLNVLRPRGHLHFVGAVGEPLNLGVFSLLSGHKSVSASPLGSPATIATMLDFCARHHIRPETEVYPFTQVNKAMAALREKKPAHRIVLTHA